MVALDLGPVVHHIDVGLSPDPRHGCRVANQRAGESVVDGEAHLAAGEWLPGDVYAGDTDGGCVVGSIRVGVGRVAQVGDAYAGFGAEARREDVIPVAAGAVGILGAVGFKAATLWTAQEVTERRRLVGGVVLKAVPAAEVILLSGGEVNLNVVAV